MILVNNLVGPGPNCGHLRTFSAIQWECELYTEDIQRMAQGSLLSIQFDWALFPGKEPPGIIMKAILHAI